MHSHFRALLVVAVGGAMLGGCSSNSSPGPFATPPPPSTTYTQTATVQIPGVPPTTGTFSFDISFVDTTAGLYYLADRTTNGVDVVNASTLSYLRTAGKGLFQGPGTAGPGGSPAVNGGPNGVVPVPGGMVVAGDGDSTIKIVNSTSGALVATIPAVNPVTTGTFSFCGAPTTGKANARVDEMDYDPTDNVVMVVNDASCPPFATFISGTAPYTVLGSLAFSTADGGAEQPRWDPTQKLFTMALPSTTANPGGEIDLISPTTFKVVKSFATPNNCAPAGNALGPNEVEVLGCGGPDILVINATNGNVINRLVGQGGCDEAWYNPADNRFYVGCSNNTSSPRLVIIDGSGNLITYLAGSTGAHSVAAYNNTVFFPQRANGVLTFTHQ